MWYDSKNWILLLNVTLRIKPFFSFWVCSLNPILILTLRIELFQYLKIFSIEFTDLHPFQQDSKNWTGFPKFDSKNWTFSGIWPNGLNPLHKKTPFSKISFKLLDFLTWLTELNFLQHDITHRIEPFFIKIRWIWILIFNMSQREWLHFWIWKYMTRRIMILWK